MDVDVLSRSSLPSRFNARFLKYQWNDIWPLITKRTDVLAPHVLMISIREIRWFAYAIVLKFAKHLCNAAAQLPVKYRKDLKSLRPNFAASELYEILKKIGNYVTGKIITTYISELKKKHNKATPLVAVIHIGYMYFMVHSHHHKAIICWHAAYWGINRR